MAVAPRRAYADLPSGAGNWQLHYREAGAGYPVVVLHPSPLSSAFMLPVLECLAGDARVIAWDAPGYGASDPLPGSGDPAPEGGLGPWVEALAAFIDSLGLEPPVVYGSATGAQIAIEFAKAHPQRTRGLLLENVAWFHADEVEEIMDGYFPDPTPSADGAHLLRLWRMASRSPRYFPWYSERPEDDIRGEDLPPAVAQALFNDHLRAGPGYAAAYRAAFRNEDAERLRAVPVETRIIRWDDGLIRRYSDRLDDASLPGHITMRFAGTGMAARWAAVRDACLELLPG